MSQELGEEQLIRSYFLGELPQSEQERVLERLFTDQEFFETSLIIEGELVDDYALGLISEQDRAKLERGLLMSPHEYRKVEFVKTLDRYIANKKVTSESDSQSATLVNGTSKNEEAFWERLLDEAQANRNLIESLITDNWLGLELLLQVKEVPHMTQSELSSLTERDEVAVSAALSDLVECGVVDEAGRKYSCSWFGSKILEKFNRASG